MNTKSKKDLLMLGLLGVGAIALASQVADTEEGDTKKMRMGGGGFPIGGIMPPDAPAAQKAASITYILPKADVTFPSAPTFDIGRILAPSRPAEIYTPPLTPVTSRRHITSAYERLRASGFDPITTITGTTGTPAFVQKDIYHKKMVEELGL